MRRLELLDRIEREWKGCQRCDLSKDRSRVVNWRGNPIASIMIIGEAPGYDEDRLGRPFVGRAGRMLDEILTEVGLDHSEDVFIANMVGCRPPNNRNPTREEIAACSKRLSSLLVVNQPKVILLLGTTAAQLAGAGSVTQHRGREAYVERWLGKTLHTVSAVISWHPAFLLRQGPSHYSRQQAIVDFKLALSISKR